jgi:protein-S-isoprenylcysteine O-methyltransferase Ste14
VSEDKDSAAVRVPPPLVTVLTIVLGYILGRYLPLVDGYGWPSPDRYWIGGAFVVITGAVLGAWPIMIFRRTEQDPRPWTTTPEIIIEGPYKFTRNPMYLMMLFFCAGFSIILAEAWVLALTPVCAAIIFLTAIRHEEVYLEAKFGDSYVDYKRRVRRWI